MGEMEKYDLVLLTRKNPMPIPRKLAIKMKLVKKNI